MNENNSIEYLAKLARATGIASASVNDGRVILISKDKLQSLVKQAEDKGYVFLHIKNPEFSKDTSN